MLTIVGQSLARNQVKLWLNFNQNEICELECHGEMLNSEIGAIKRLLFVDWAAALLDARASRQIVLVLDATDAPFARPVVSFTTTAMANPRGGGLEANPRSS